MIWKKLFGSKKDVLTIILFYFIQFAVLPKKR